MARIIGIMGGMGPEATIDLHTKLFEECTTRGASRDQDHPDVVVSSVCATPDRTAHMMGKGEDPLPYLVRSAERLVSAGASLCAIACNTAHYYLPAISAAVPSLEFVSLPEACAAEAARRDCSAVGVLAAPGTVATGLYTVALEKVGVRAIYPDESGQKTVTWGIFDIVKAGKPHAEAVPRMYDVVRALASRGAAAVIAGCTEIPLVLPEEGCPLPVIDSNREAVRELLDRSGWKPGGGGGA